MIDDINKFEKRIFSQNGEDGILEAIFNQIGTTNKFLVEFGVLSYYPIITELGLHPNQNGQVCNSRYFIEKKGWKGLLMDCADTNNPNIKKEFITAENVNKVFKKYNVPKKFDLLSIDIDGNDYWVWKALKGYEPRVVIIEYNASVPVDQSKVVPYNPDFSWSKDAWFSSYFGASLLALVKLAKKKGYALVGCDNTGANAFFVKDNLIKGNFKVKSIGELYRPPRYGIFRGLFGWGWFPTPIFKLFKNPKPMLEV